MKLFFETHYLELEQKLAQLHSESDLVLFVSEQALLVITQCLKTVNAKLSSHRFDNEAEEIDFFRNRKPLVTSKLIYFHTLFLIESCKPVGDKKTIKSYYRAHLQKLERYFADNIEFYRYYRSGSSDLDTLYFRRGVSMALFLNEGFHWERDPSLCTSHDYKVAYILANDLLQAYLERALVKLDADPASPPELEWTGPKVGLVELIYALHSAGVFNDGKAMLKDVCNSIETAFHIELGHIPRHFMEIRGRKNHPARFLESLSESLCSRISKVER